jgi:branched-chain amino acid transport system substrate-binding protein
MRQITITLLAAAALAAVGVARADVKIGFLGTLSGPSADVGRDQLDGFNLALAQLGGKLGGQATTVVVEDDQQKPEVALGAVTKLLERDKVDLITGLTFANVLMALQAKIGATDVPFVGSVAGPSAVAGAACKPNLFITSWQSDVPAEAVGKHMANKAIKRISTLTPNFVGGKDKITGLKRYYKGEIVDEIYTPLNQLDFSAELTRLAASKPDAVYAFYPGGLGVTFVRQYQQAGLLGKIPLYTTNTIEGAAIDAMGAAAIGAVVADTWTPGSPGEDSARFVEGFQKKYGRLPSAYAAFSYDAARLIDAALKATKSGTADRKEFTKAIATTSFKSVRGPFKFGPNNFPVQNYHVFQVTKGSNGKPALGMLDDDVLTGHADSYAGQCAMR